MTQTVLPVRRVGLSRDGAGRWEVRPQATEPEGIHLHLAELPVEAFRDPLSQAGLPQTDRAAANAFLFHEDRVRCIVARQLLRRVLAAWCGASPEDLPLTRDKGRPFLALLGAPALSVSHSGRFVAVAVGGCARLGVDVEVDAGQPLDAARVASLVFSEAERTALAAAGDPRAAFFRLWTRKEALLKTLGCGFSGRPATRCSLAAEAAGTVSFASEVRRGDAYLTLAQSERKGGP